MDRTTKDYVQKLQNALKSSYGYVLAHKHEHNTVALLERIKELVPGIVEGARNAAKPKPHEICEIDRQAKIAAKGKRWKSNCTDQTIYRQGFNEGWRTARVMILSKCPTWVNPKVMKEWIDWMLEFGETKDE